MSYDLLNDLKIGFFLTFFVWLIAKIGTAMDETILTWNATNWITVLLMALVGWLVIVGILRLMSGGKGAVASG